MNLRWVHAVLIMLSAALAKKPTAALLQTRGLLKGDTGALCDRIDQEISLFQQALQDDTTLKFDHTLAQKHQLSVSWFRVSGTDLIPLLGRRDEVLAPVFDPLHGTSKQKRGQRNDKLLAVEYELRTEAASDVRRDDAHALFLTAEHMGEHAHGSVGRLGRTPDGQDILVGIVRGDDFDGCFHTSAMHVDADFTFRA